MSATIDAAVVEGLFIRGLTVDAPLADELKSVGIDLKRLAPKYSGEVWRRGLDVGGKRLFPALSQAEADRELGRRFTAGFNKTILGGVMGAAMSLLGIEAFIKRLPKALAMDGNAKPEAKQHAPGHWTIEPVLNGFSHFTAGSLESWAARFKERPVITVDDRPMGYALVFRWVAKA